MRRIELITTGGTIEKTYDEFTGDLSNRGSIVRRMLEGLRLEDTSVRVTMLMSKDSLEITPDEREQIVQAAARAGERSDAVVILHGTDTLSETGELLFERLGRGLHVPVVLTGAMRPFEMRRSDALQNLTEALVVSSVLGPGVYAACHGRVLRFPGVEKDREAGTFRGMLAGVGGAPRVADA